MTTPTPPPVRALFMQSQAYFGADSRVHATVMAHLEPDEAEVHVAVNAGEPGRPPDSLVALQALGERVRLRPTRFGPTLMAERRSQVLRNVVVGGPRAVVSLAGLVRYARRHRIQVVHGTEKPRDAFYGHLLARAIGAKSVVHVHVKAAGWMSPLVRWTLRRTDVIVAISEYVRQTLIDEGYDATRIVVVPNALEPAGWDRADVDGDAVRRELQIAPDQPLIAIISRMFAWKGHLELVDALPTVVEQHPDLVVLVVGEDDERATPGRGSLTAEMQERADERGVRSHLLFTGFRADVPAIMAAIDAFVMPSFEEPFGMVFLESMAMQTPVVALDNGGTPEVVADGETGLLSAPGDIEGLSANILAMLADPERRRAMGAAGRRRALEVFPPRRLASGVLEMWRDVVGPRDR